MEARTPPRYAASTPHAVTNFRAYLPASCCAGLWQATDQKSKLPKMALRRRSIVKKALTKPEQFERSAANIRSAHLLISRVSGPNGRDNMTGVPHESPSCCEVQRKFPWVPQSDTGRQLRTRIIALAQHLRRSSDTFSGAIARWSRRKVKAPVSAVLQAFGAISSMVSPMRPHRSRPGEPVLNRTATLVAITLISAVTTPVVINATASKMGVAVATPAAERTCARRIKVVYAGYGKASPGNTLHHSRPLSRCAARGWGRARHGNPDLYEPVPRHRPSRLEPPSGDRAGAGQPIVSGARGTAPLVGA